MKLLFGIASAVFLLFSDAASGQDREPGEVDYEEQAERVQFSLEKGHGLKFTQVADLDRITGQQGIANVINELSATGQIKGDCKASSCTIEYETETSGEGGIEASGGLLGGKADAGAKTREKFKITGPCKEVLKILEEIRNRERDRQD